MTSLSFGFGCWALLVKLALFAHERGRRSRNAANDPIHRPQRYRLSHVTNSRLGWNRVEFDQTIVNGRNPTRIGIPTDPEYRPPLSLITSNRCFFPRITRGIGIVLTLEDGTA